MTSSPTAPRAVWPPVLGVLLAGGMSSRMGGGEKCLKELAGKTLLARTIERTRPQVAALVLSANGDLSRFAAYGLPVIGDPPGIDRAPAAGVLAGMEWAVANRPDLNWVATFATDMPFFPRYLVKWFLKAVERRGTDMAFAASGEARHPVFGLYPAHATANLRRAVERGGVDADLSGYGYTKADVKFPTAPLPPFFNINTPRDLEEAERLIAAHGEPPM